MTIIGIDPGASGGIAWVLSNKSIDQSIGCKGMPDTETDIIDLIRSIVAKDIDTLVVIEEVGGFCGVGQPGSAMFKFGFSAGFLRGVVMAFGCRVEIVRPQKWQKHFSLGTSKQAGGKSEWKRKLKAEAQRRYPALDITLKTADAVLLMDYGVAEHRQQV